MPQAKRYRFTPQQQELATLGRVIGHPARVLLLESIRREEILLFHELAKVIPLSPPSVSRHLQELVKVGIIELAEHPLNGSGYQLNQSAYEEFREKLRLLELFWEETG